MHKSYPKIFTLLVSFVIIATSCSDSSHPDLTGVWEIEELKITMNTFNNSDSAEVIEANGKNWETKMKSRNIKTYYNSDGTYHSLHKDLNDNITYDPAGTWKIINDSLIIQDTFPKPVTYKFKLKVQEDLVEYWGLEDFDQDGKADDEYYSKQRRVEEVGSRK